MEDFWEKNSDMFVNHIMMVDNIFSIKIHWKYVQNGFPIKYPANAIDNAIVDQVNQETHKITAKNWSDEIELYTQVHIPCSVHWFQSINKKHIKLIARKKKIGKK